MRPSAVGVTFSMSSIFRPSGSLATPKMRASSASPASILTPSRQTSWRALWACAHSTRAYARRVVAFGGGAIVDSTMHSCSHSPLGPHFTSPMKTRRGDDPTPSFTTAAGGNAVDSMAPTSRSLRESTRYAVAMLPTRPNVGKPTTTMAWLRSIGSHVATSANRLSPGGGAWIESALGRPRRRPLAFVRARVMKPPTTPGGKSPPSSCGSWPLYGTGSGDCCGTRRRLRAERRDCRYALRDDYLPGSDEADDRREVATDRVEDDREARELVGEDEVLQESLEGQGRLRRHARGRVRPEEGREGLNPQGPAERERRGNDEQEPFEDAREEFLWEQLHRVDIGHLEGLRTTTLGRLAEPGEDTGEGHREHAQIDDDQAERNADPEEDQAQTGELERLDERLPLVVRKH